MSEQEPNYFAPRDGSTIKNDFKSMYTSLNRIRDRMTLIMMAHNVNNIPPENIFAILEENGDTSILGRYRHLLLEWAVLYMMLEQLDTEIHTIHKKY